MQPLAALRRRSDVTTFHGLGLFAAILGLAATCAGCSDDPFTALSPGPHAAPTRAADCDDLPALGGYPGILLCTDGLTTHVSDDEIKEHLARCTSAESCCRSLLDLALARGGKDNVTVVVARVRSKDEAHATAK